jgi:hypothetical protein
MAQFTIEIPDQLLPALVVEFGLVQGSTTATTPEEYFEASIVETVRQRAESYKVGPYYVGPIPPTWNADGTPYVAPIVENEPGTQTNDTTVPVEEGV